MTTFLIGENEVSLERDNWGRRNFCLQDELVGWRLISDIVVVWKFVAGKIVREGFTGKGWFACVVASAPLPQAVGKR